MKEGSRQYLIGQYVEKHRQDKRYGAGRTFHGQVHAWLVFEGYRTVVDFGCGKGGLVRHLQAEGFEVQGYDPAVPEFMTPPTVAADAVVCLDVLEHLSRESLQKELRLMAAMANGGAFLNIATRPAYHTLPDGRNCHEIVEPWEWWEQELKKAFRAFEIEPAHVEEHQATVVLRRRNRES